MDLKIEDLTVLRGGGTVLRHLDLDLYSGEMLGIIGKNGAGKTTLLEAVCGLLPVSSGAVRLGTDDVSGRRAEDTVRRGLALVPEGRQLFPNLTVMENLSLGAFNTKWFWRKPSSQSLQEVWDVFPDLFECRGKLCGALSGGQQQMVAVGRALASQPKILMLDEPTFGLSPQLAEAMCARLVDLKSAGFSVVLAEQNIDVVFDVVPRVAVLAGGKIALDGPVESVRDSATVREAMFGILPSEDSNV